MRHPGAKWKNALLFTGPGASDRLIVTVIGINIFMFLLSLVIGFHPAGFSLHPLAFLSPSSQSLLILGSTGTIPLLQLDRWWSLLSAGYLHGGLLHIVFNMIAFRQLAPVVLLEYGVNRTIILYTLGSVGGFVLSAFAGVPFTLGASAAICSLIGAMLYYGKSRGGIYGDALFSQIGGWALGIFVFGFLVPGINNWAHGGGMLSGAVLGYFLGYRERQEENFSHRLLAMLCAAATVLALAWSCLNGVAFAYFSR
jgi:rhomboid protease GluP